MESESPKFDWELFRLSPLYQDIKRVLVAILVFVVTASSAYGLYWLTLPEGLPWNVEPRYLDGWKWAALATGLLATVVNRYLGWRVGIGVALFWMFMPFVWDGAILGTSTSLHTSYTLCGLWVANAIFLWVTRKARWVQFSDEEPETDETEMCGFEGWRRWINGIVAWAVLGASALFAIVSVWWHDYQLGEPATSYARDIIATAGDRVIVLNDVCDKQIMAELERAGKTNSVWAIAIDTDEANRARVAAWARQQWPNETNLLVSAQVGIEPFLNFAVRVHPDRFYVMNGGSETLEQWERRWKAFAPYLESRDPFVRIALRSFAYQGNAIGNALREKGAEGERTAWRLYKRISMDIERGNIAALVNMSEMMRRGFKVTDIERTFVLERITTFLSLEYNRQHAGEIARAAGPVKSDHELIARMSEWAKAKLEETRGHVVVRHELTEEEKLLIEQNNSMIRAANRGDWEVAGYLARKILSMPRWHGYIPANAIMGDIASMSGDYVSSEAFYRIATSTTNETPAAVWNNYADTLMHLGKMNEAEAILREGISRTEETFWYPRITLAEVLTQKIASLPPTEQEAVRAEVRGLVDGVVKSGSADVIRYVRDEIRAGKILK